MRSRWWIALLGGLSCVTPVAPTAPEPPPPPPIVVPDGCLELQAGPWEHGADPSFQYAGDDDGGTLTLAVERLLVPDAGFIPRRFRDAGVLDAGVSDAGQAARKGATARTPDAGAPRDGGVDAGTVDGGALDGGADGGRDAGPEASDAGASAFADSDGGSTPTIFITLTRTPGGFVGEAVTTLRHPSGRLCEVRFPTKVLACGDGGLTLETDSAAAIGDACQAPARPQGLTREVHQLVRPRAR